jgi:hypothetical protein
MTVPSGGRIERPEGPGITLEGYSKAPPGSLPRTDNVDVYNYLGLAGTLIVGGTVILLAIRRLRAKATT